MNTTDLHNLIAGGESETLEFKKSTTQLKAAAESLCAFLNNSGGKVLIGVTDNGKVIGQELTDSTRQEIARTLRGFEPPCQWAIKNAPDGHPKVHHFAS